MIQINVNGSVVSVQESEALYCGSQNVYTCCFTFDKGWEKYSKSAVFRVNGKAITAFVDEENTCVLPWELLVRDHIGSDIEVGVYGVSAESEIITSIWDRIGAVREGSELGSDAREPSAGVYEQVLANVQKVDNKILSYSAEVQTLTQRAESAAAVAVNKAQSAEESRYAAAGSAAAATSAKKAVETALDRIPAGSTLVINDLTTGGATAALSAEQGKVLSRRPNPNILHNWNFANPINQRGFETEAGSTSLGYLIDRWTRAGYTSGVLTLVDDGLTINGTATTGGANQIYQKLENVLPAGTYTLSLLVTEVIGTGVLMIANANGKSCAYRSYTEPGLYSVTYTGADVGRVYINAQAGGSVTVKAVKLECGSVQTLAHWDGSKYVLNEIPDYGEELTKCQRYYQLFSSEDLIPSALVDFRPNMRIQPKTGLVELANGSYAFADANL